MNPALTFQTIEVSALVTAAMRLKESGWRLVQIGATRLPDTVELTYTFDRDLELTNLRVNLPADAARLPSISSIYWCAFLYENELHDLFNLQVEGMAVDFHGAFYKTTIPFPFAAAPKSKPPPPKPATTPTTNAVAATAATTDAPISAAPATGATP